MVTASSFPQRWTAAQGQDTQTRPPPELPATSPSGSGLSSLPQARLQGRDSELKCLLHPIWRNRSPRTQLAVGFFLSLSIFSSHSPPSLYAQPSFQMAAAASCPARTPPPPRRPQKAGAPGGGIPLHLIAVRVPRPFPSLLPGVAPSCTPRSALARAPASPPAPGPRHLGALCFGLPQVSSGVGKSSRD